MADKQDPDDPKYDWLYSGRSPESDEGHQQSGDPEATQRLSPADPEATQQWTPPPDGFGGAPASEEATPPANADEHTQVLKVPPRQESESPRPAQPAGPTSFGGTYDAPPAGRDSQSQRSEPRFATAASPTSPPRQPPATRPSRPPRRPRRHRNWWLRGILGLILVWVLFLVAVPIWAFSQITNVDAEPSGSRPDDTPGTTYLLVGSDSREDLTEQERGDLGTGNAVGQRTDTIIVLQVPSGPGPNVLLSLPRDSYVDIPGKGQNKINAAYAFGGPELLVATVEQNTGLRIDDYIEVGFTGFVDVVDAVGGIRVCPTSPIDDPKAGNLKMDKGCQDVDGNTALQYSRSRAFGNGDITRAQHQREVIASVGQRVASWQTVVLPWRYFTINKAGAESLQMGEEVGPFDLARFAWAMAHSSGDDAKRCVIPIRSLGASTPAGSAVLWDEEAAQDLFGQIADDDTASIECTESGQ
ncbi:MAG: LCP family protein [Nocardioidaceae bacterium]|nr:LCP family protein [Nocardioidaceae bacterium]